MDNQGSTLTTPSYQQTLEARGIELNDVEFTPGVATAKVIDAETKS